MYLMSSFQVILLQFVKHSFNLQIIMPGEMMKVIFNYA